MTSLEALQECVREHCAEGMEKHPDFKNVLEGRDAIVDCIGWLNKVLSTTSTPHTEPEVAKRVLQIAGLCLKTMVNCDLGVVKPSTAKTQAGRLATT